MIQQYQHFGQEEAGKGANSPKFPLAVLSLRMSCTSWMR